MKIEIKRISSKKITPLTEDLLIPMERENFILEELKEHAKQIEKGVIAKEQRFIWRVIRSINVTRKQLNSSILRRIITIFYNNAPTQKESLLAYIKETMNNNEMVAEIKPKYSVVTLLPEQDVYFHLLLIIYLIDLRNYKSAIKCSDLLIAKICKFNRRTLDLLAAKSYYYHTRCYELNNQLSEIKCLFHRRLQITKLRGDCQSQSVLLNSLLRIYLHYNLYSQASKLVSKSNFPENATNNEWARFLYYVARIKAIQLEYSESRRNLLQAIRRAPQRTAIGFKQNVNKLAIIVELLLGDKPERATFRNTTLIRSPYFQLTQTVCTGNMKQFNEVLEKFGPEFQADHMYTLIIRLRHIVIKHALRMINQSYSQIYLKNIGEKLMLDNVQDAEYIVMKAIHDGVIEAKIDHERGIMQSKKTADIFYTLEPFSTFSHRISFCLDIYNQSMKAMRFPPLLYRDLKSSQTTINRQ